jgi:hypothetical protein
MTRMKRQDFWRSFYQGHGLAALFVNYKPPSVQDEKRIAQYAFIARSGAVALLAVAVASVFILVKTGHPRAGLVLVGFVIFTTIMQLLDHTL